MNLALLHKRKFAENMSTEILASKFLMTKFLVVMGT